MSGGRGKRRCARRPLDEETGRRRRCVRAVYARGLCVRHYIEARREGKLPPTRMPKNFEGNARRFVATHSPEEDERIRTMYLDEGLGIPTIARELGRAQSFVMNRMDALGLERDGSRRGRFGRRVSEEEIELLRRMYEDMRLSLGEISRRLGVPQSTLHSRATLYGIKLRTPPEVQQLAWERRRLSGAGEEGGSGPRT